MAKRKKKRGTPNISAEAIERARQQLGDAESTEQTADPVQKTESAERRRRRERREQRREQRAQGQSEVVQYSQLSKRKRDELDNETIEEMLANPTKFVTEDELRADYHHVITDLRSMGILAGVLLVVLVALGQLI